MLFSTFFSRRWNTKTLLPQIWPQNGLNSEKNNKVIKKLNSSCLGTRGGWWFIPASAGVAFLGAAFSFSKSLVANLQVEYLYSLVYQMLDFISNKK